MAVVLSEDAARPIAAAKLTEADLDRAIAEKRAASSPITYVGPTAEDRLIDAAWWLVGLMALACLIVACLAAAVVPL